jgi:transposase-like protein
MKKCIRCQSEKVIKDGRSAGKQRFVCKECGKSFGGEGKYSLSAKDYALMMYLNNVGIRKTGYF